MTERVGTAGHPPPARLAIVDDHQLLVETLTVALAASGIDVIPVAPRPARELVQALRSLAPDLILLDLDLGPSGDATPAIRQLVDAGIRVLVVSGIPDRIRVAEALEQGAIGYQSKADGFDALLDAARSALTAAEPLDPEGRAALLAELRDHRLRRAARWKPFADLTDREQQTLRALADGRTVHEIARAWVVSLPTVRSHVQAVLRKLDVTSQLEAVALARTSGWLDGAAVPDAVDPDPTAARNNGRSAMAPAPHHQPGHLPHHR